MKLEQTIARKIKVSEVYGLDPISIYLEDFEPRKGKITISCYDKSWHSYWGGMGDRTIDKFFLSCDNHYIAKNLSTISGNINDYEALGKKIKEFYKDDYENNEFEAIELYEAIDSMSDDHNEWDAWIRNDAQVMTEVFGCDWWYSIPTMANPQYIYLCKIIDTVKEALRSVSCQHSLGEREKDV